MSNFEEDLEEGAKFLDYILQRLQNMGIMTYAYTSAHNQMHTGETAGGIEVKFDNRCKSTGNIYIEYAAISQKGEWYSASLDKKDNTWLWIIGDYEKSWAIPKKVLKAARHKYKQVQTATSKGYLLPIDRAEVYCCFKL